MWKSLRSWFAKTQADPIQAALKSLGRQYRPFSFVQVGSSDGDLNDPLRGHIHSGAAKGAFIEPLPRPFQKLRAQYENFSGLEFFNCAIGETEEPRPMYVIEGNEPELPPWFYQVASFKREVLLAHAKEIPDIESRIRAVSVQCRRLDTIIAESKLRSIDCLHIDTEGYDYEVLKLFPFHLHKPSLVIFEHKHLTRAENDMALGLLIEIGYEVQRLGVDTMASR